MVTDAVSARVPPCWVAITRNVPAVAPAVYAPVPETVPPVADQFTLTLDVLPSDMRPIAENCCPAPGDRFTLEGVTSTPVNVGAAGVMVTTDVSALVPPCWVAMTRKLPAVLPAV